jgi:poly-gamma-glutamate capsule biosynthesis protein CapA/YwtB (metallophosphatase superfamily)
MRVYVPLVKQTYNGKPILFGCGDFINDYEGIRVMRVIGMI